MFSLVVLSLVMCRTAAWCLVALALLASFVLCHVCWGQAVSGRPGLRCCRVDLRLPLADFLLLRSPRWWTVSVCKVKLGRNVVMFELFLSWWLYTSSWCCRRPVFLFVLLFSPILLSFGCCGELLLFGWFVII
jgi:hypothetical protein